MRFYKSSSVKNKVTAIQFPSVISKGCGACYKDAFMFTANKADLTAQQVYFAIFAELPQWVKGLLTLRNKVVSLFGFLATDNNMGSRLTSMKTGESAGFLRYQLVSDEQVVSTSEEPNMAIWLTVKRVSQSQFIVATEVE